MGTHGNRRERWFRITALVVVFLAFLLGIVLDQTTTIGGFELGVFTIWILVLLLPVTLVAYEFRPEGGAQ